MTKKLIHSITVNKKKEFPNVDEDTTMYLVFKLMNGNYIFNDLVQNGWLRYYQVMSIQRFMKEYAKHILEGNIKNEDLLPNIVMVEIKKQEIAEIETQRIWKEKKQQEYARQYIE